MPEPRLIRQHRERFARDPRDRAAFEALEEHHYLDAAWSELERLYAAHLDALGPGGDREAQARVLVRWGGILERGRADGDAALARYREAAERAPGFRPALAALRRIHATRGEWELVLQIAELELAAPMPRRERAALHVECAEAWSRHAGDHEQALCHLRLARQDDPRSGAAAVAMARALEALDQPEEALEAWRQARPLLTGPARARACAAEARLAEIHADDDDGATALYRAALEDDPDHREALTALTNLAARAGDWDEVLALQTRRFALAGEAAEQARIAFGAARGRIEHAADPAGALPWLARALERREAPGAPGARRILDLALEGARVARERGDEAAAAELYEIAVGLDPGQAEALAGLAEARYALGDLEAATCAVEARLALSETEPDAARHTLHVGIAAAGLEARGRNEEALAGYLEVLEQDPGHDAARAGALRILEDQGRAAEAAALLDAWAARTPDPRLRAERLVRAAALGRDGGDDDARVVARLDEVLARDPECGEAWILLAAVRYEAGESDAALDAARRGLATVREPAARARLLVTRATLLEERGDDRAAAGTWAAAAEEAPEDPAPLGCALHLLQRTGDWHTATRVIERVLRRLGDRDAARRADLLAELGRLRAGPLEDLDGAIAAYRAAREAAPDREDLAAALARLLRHRPHPAAPAPQAGPGAPSAPRARRRSLITGLLRS